jgi:hypothetical protein
MTIVITRDAETFAGQATALLESRVQNNVLATVLGIAAGRPRRCGRRAVCNRAAGRPRGGGGAAHAAASDAGHEMHPDAARELIDRWLDEDRELPGVTAVTATARALAAAWAQRTSAPTATRMRMAMHIVEAITDPPRPAPGALRPATDADLPTLIPWRQAFAVETGSGADRTGVHAPRAAPAWLRGLGGGGRQPPGPGRRREAMRPVH